MLDEFLEFFGRRFRRPEAKAHHPLRRQFDEFVAGDDDDGDGERRFRHDEDRHRDPRSNRFDRRPRVEDWD